jgi:hypothetical protein
MKNGPFLFMAILVALPYQLFSQTTVTIDASSDPKPISSYLYGKNNSLSDDPANPLTSAAWTRLRDAGVTFLRESGGNNCTKYNWRRKLSSHPDWYNNVYAHDWDFAVISLQNNLPAAQGMWAFQLLGKVAKTTGNNFNDWGYNQSQWWQGVNQNLAGGGLPNTQGGNKALQEGNPDLYLEDWKADSTVKILTHWFDELALDKTKVRYWNMDNEVEIWNGTHDDVMPVQLTPEAFIQKYIDVAKKARATYPEIKIVGPVTANEWQWYNWTSEINIDGKHYPWLEFFIKRVAEEQKASGIRLLDVLDLHFYPGSTKAEEVVQMHRVFFDKEYVFPEANGVRTINGGYDNSQTKEYIFERCRGWLEQYMGANHGVTFGLTETGIANTDPSTVAVWYASTLGEFMKHPEVELFSPWSWSTGMWEVLHLYSRYNKPLSLPATSSEEEFVSAYPTINAQGDSLTVTLVNRSISAAKSVAVNFKGFVLNQGSVDALTLSNLPATETFVSHNSNALQQSSVAPNGNVLNVSLPPLSIVTLRLNGQKKNVVTGTMEAEMNKQLLEVFPNPVLSDGKLTIRINHTGTVELDLIDAQGKTLMNLTQVKINSLPFERELDISHLPKGMYLLRLNLNGKTISQRFVTF